MHALELHAQDIVLFRDSQTLSCLAASHVTGSVDFQPAPLLLTSPIDGRALKDGVSKTEIREKLGPFCFLVELLPPFQAEGWVTFRTVHGQYLQSIGQRLLVVDRPNKPNQNDSDVRSILFRLAPVHPPGMRSYILETFDGNSLKLMLGSGSQLLLLPKEMLAGMSPEIVFQVSILSSSPPLPITESMRSADPPTPQKETLPAETSASTSILERAKQCVLSGSKKKATTSSGGNSTSMSNVSAGWIALSVLLGLAALLLFGGLIYWTFRFDVIPKDVSRPSATLTTTNQAGVLNDSVSTPR